MRVRRPSGHVPLRPDLDSYVFGAFAHRLREVLRKERTIEFVASDSDLAELKQAQDWSWVAAFENSLELKAAVDEMEDWMKEVLHRWAFDEPWDQISEDMGVTTNALKKRFAYHLKKIRSRMLNADRPFSAKS
jgi:DNA-directed RNA polymerase specialized sigma24 family protein